MLSDLDLYAPLRISDAMMGIANTPKTRTITYGSSNVTIDHRKDFIGVLGFPKFPVGLYTYKAGGNIPMTVYVFRVKC